MRNLEFFIPKGIYCYGHRQDGKFVTCPFLRFDKTKHYQENGICEAFKLRDDSAYGGLLWDMVKECNVNDEYEYE